MTEFNTRRASLLKWSLFTAYAAMVLFAAVELGQGGVSGSSLMVRVFPIGLLVLIAATMFVQKYANEASRGRADILKAIGCFAGIFPCVIIAVKFFPDTQITVTVLSALIFSGIFVGLYYLMRFLGVGFRAMTSALMTTQTMITRAPDTSVLEKEAGSDRLSDRVEIQLDYRTIILRFLGICSLAFLYWWFYARSNIFGKVVIPLAYLFATIQISRYLIGRGPAMVMDNAGIALHRNISSIHELHWSEITTLELRSHYSGAYLVIGLKDPEALIAKRGALGRWSMRQSKNMFGSPIRIPTFFLKCDRNWLARTAGEFKLRSKGTSAGCPIEHSGY